MKKLIVVHDGIAHEDDMVSAGALLYHLFKTGTPYEDIQVVRLYANRGIRLEDIPPSASDIYYADVGKVYDGVRKMGPSPGRTFYAKK